MSLVIGQTAAYVGDDRWNWSIWIEGTDNELDEIESVEYVLHPTFPRPVIVVTRRDTKFRLDASGWGEFQINAHAATKDGRTQHLRHWLRLGERADSSSTPKRKPAVFLSASIADAEWEDAVRSALTGRGIDVFTASDLPSGVPWDAAITSAIDNADIMVGIFSEKSSSMAEREVLKAIDQNVSIVPVLVGSQMKVPTKLQGIPAVHIREVSDVESAVGRIVNDIGVQPVE